VPQLYGALKSAPVIQNNRKAGETASSPKRNTHTNRQETGLLKVTSVPVSFFTPIYRLTGQHMETLSKIYRYEVDLQPASVPKTSSPVIYAITDSMTIAERMLRIEYPSLMMYSISTIQRFTIVADNCSYSDIVFSVDIKTSYDNKAECFMEIKILIVARSLLEALKLCFNRYRIDIKDIQIVPMDGVVMPRGLIGIEG